jgi:hypothetical protein
MSYPQTQVPETQASVWYSHSLHIGGRPIGTFERFSTRSTRTTERIREILFSRGPEVREIVWGGTDITLDLNRVELYNTALFEAFGFDIYSLEDLNQHINITELQKNPASTGGRRVITYMDAVASDWGKDVDTGTVRIVETMTFQVRTIRGYRE